MTFSIENELVSIKIKQTGAELCSYFDKTTNREIIWQADPNHWKRHTPILFPIVGKVEKNEYRIADKVYSLSQHGFARDQSFNLINKSDNSILLEIESNDDLKKIYPFEFKLQVEFILNSKELQVLYRVINPSSTEIFFCIGAHPGFNCPFNSASNFNEYKLKFEHNEEADRILLTLEGFRNGKRSNNWLNANEINLKEELFNEDALIFDELKSSFLLIETEKSLESVKVGWHNYPHMGIWKPLNNAPFICIEPWNGMADQAGLHNDFRDKYGVINLSGNKSFECYYTIENIVK